MVLKQYLINFTNNFTISIHTLPRCIFFLKESINQIKVVLISKLFKMLIHLYGWFKCLIHLDSAQRSLKIKQSRPRIHSPECCPKFWFGCVSMIYPSHAQEYMPFKDFIDILGWRWHHCFLCSGKES